MRNAVLSFLLIVTVLFCFHPLSLLTNAAPCAEEIAGTVITFDDGSYLTVSPVRTVTSEEQGGTRTVTTMQEKDVIYTNADGVDEWKYTLTGNFTYQYGAFAVCNYAYYSQTVYEEIGRFQTAPRIIPDRLPEERETSRRRFCSSRSTILISTFPSLATCTVICPDLKMTPKAFVNISYGV